MISCCDAFGAGATMLTCLTSSRMPPIGNTAMLRMMTAPICTEFNGDVPTSVQETWDAFADTERFGRLTGMDMRFSYEPAPDGTTQRVGRMRSMGLTLIWDEAPVVFDAPRHYAILRKYRGGPAERYESELRVTPTAQGAHVAMVFRFLPRNALTAVGIRLQTALVVRPQLNRAFQAILTALRTGLPIPDAAPPALLQPAQDALQAGLRDVQPDVAQHLTTWLQTAPLADQLRLKPLEMARQWHLDPRAVTVGLLMATRGGVLKAQWEVICPSCRLPSAALATFSLAARQQHCPGCDIRYDASFADAVALTLQPTPAIRSALGKVDCLSSPARMPHIAARITLPPREEVVWNVTLQPGTWRVRSLPELDAITLTVHPDATRHEVAVLAGPKVLTPPTVRLAAGEVTLRLRSKLDVPLSLLLEHADVDADTLTIGRVLEWPDAAERLPGNALEPGLTAAPWTGAVLAVHVARGGEQAEAAVAELLRAAGVRSVQRSTAWVLATLPDWAALARIAPQLADAMWLRAAVGYGTVLELTAGDARVAAGALVQELVALAHEAEPGQIRVFQAAALPELPDWTVTATPLGAELTTALRHTPLPFPTLATHALQTGDTVDERFVLGEVLGKGGFGVVYAARDTARQDDVVVKLLRQELADDPSQVQRFFDEGRLASRLQGPHAVRVHEWGLADDGRLFLAMERLDGLELGDVLKAAGTLDPVRAIDLCRQALLGLAEAHAEGLVHRDIKPANLFVTHVGAASGETVKVIDYGIALDRTGRVKAHEPVGHIIGTPLYMAPEQVTGAPLDGRCDLYALALVLYQAVSGRLPFGGSDVMAILMARLVQTPLPLDEVARQPLPAGLAELVEEALALAPDERPHDARAMADRLAAILHDAGASATWQASWQAHRGAMDALLDAPTADAPLASTDTEVAVNALTDAATLEA